MGTGSSALGKVIYDSKGLGDREHASPKTLGLLFTDTYSGPPVGDCFGGSSMAGYYFFRFTIVS